MATIRRIVVAIGAEHQYQRSVIAGIAQAPSRQREGWELVLAPGLAHQSAPWPLAWRPDGILAWTTCDQAHAALAATGIPFEDLSGGAGQLPNVRTDLPAICRLAIDHLLARGYRQLAIAAIPGDPYQTYARAMADEAGRRGLALAAHPLPWREVGRDPLGQVAEFAAWLAGLPRPIGLLCHAGGQALSAAAACRSAGLAIPDDVGLLTSDDEPLGNLLAAVPLSAVGKPEALVGERLAERLALRLAGRDPGPPEVLAPTGIIARASTELGRLGDPLVVAALAWIAANLAKPIGVDAVAAATGVSRRALERHFRDLGRTTVLAEIQRLRVAQAMTLVAGGMTVAAAATDAGMSPSALYKRFQRQYHGSPAAWAEGVRAPAR